MLDIEIDQRSSARQASYATAKVYPYRTTQTCIYCVGSQTWIASLEGRELLNGTVQQMCAKGMSELAVKA